MTPVAQTLEAQTVERPTSTGRLAARLAETLADRTAFERHRERNLRQEVIDGLQERIATDGVKYIYYTVPTLGARTVAKIVPAVHVVRNLEKGISFHRTALSDLQTDRAGDLIGGGVEAHEFCALPDPETYARLPWDTQVARIFCTAYEPPHLPEVGGRLIPFDTRALLAVMHRAFTEVTGYELRSGLEPEMSWAGEGIAPVAKPGASPSYQVENLERMRPVYEKVISYAQAMGLDMIEGDYEDTGQLELNWNYDRADLTCERMVAYRQICKQVARELGLQASFMPKPYNGQMGNGCHHNLSLWRGDENVVEDPDRVELHVTETARHAIGGLLEHAAGSMIAVAPTVNSYKRYWDAGQFAPNLANWGLDSRAAAVRISSNGRMEFRIPDASVNPFLSHIFILASIADGLERGIDPGPAFGEESGDSIPRLLPTTLGDAIEAFRSDAYLQSVIPESLWSLYLELKEDEWARYCGAITDYEFNTYWEAIP